MATRRRSDRVVMTLTCVSILLAAGLVYEHSRLADLETRVSRVEGRSIERKTAVGIAGAPVKGSRSAPAALVVYSDFQCPYCRGFALTTLGKIEREYVTSGKLLIAFKHFPLEKLHNSAIRAAEAASCANKQGSFWVMHDRLFTGPNIPDEAGLAEWVSAAGLERKEFSDCLAKHADRAQIQRDAAEARNLGFTGTPAFVLGLLEGSTVTVTHRIRGARPPEDFASAIDQVLRGWTSGLY